MSEVSCGLSPESTEAVKKLTVGTVFKVRCQGDWPGGTPNGDASLKDWELRADGADPYVLKLLSLERIADDVVELGLTSYRVGPRELKAVQLVSSEHAVLLGDLSFTVNSVQNPEEPVTEPFGPRPELALPFPWPFLAILFFVVGAALALALRPGIIRRRHARWMAEIPPVRSATPEQELYRIVRTGASLSAFDEGFRFFLARRFAVPAHRLTTPQILKALKRASPELFERHGEVVRETLVELRRAQGLGAAISESDIEGIRVRIRKILHALDLEIARLGRAGEIARLGRAGDGRRGNP